MKTLVQTLVMIGVAGFASSASGTLIGCGSSERAAFAGPALACETGSGNPDGGSFFGGDWTSAAVLEGESGNGALSINLLLGDWNESTVAGTWTIQSAFWETYGEGVISIHVGNGGGDPDWFAWLLEPGAEQGLWVYSRLGASSGGGFSNFKLWGGSSVSVPEPATISLLGLGLLAIGFAGRRRRWRAPMPH